MRDVLEKTANELQIDRSGWKLVKFGDVAIQQKESVDRENTTITRYVKGEHMYSEDLHLREWGDLEDEYLGPAFIRKFEEGDILYGSRRTYLRKVTIAPFEGITSNTTFVIKANEKFIDKKLLPFLMLSEGFSEHSIRNSKGSVNPYVNWKDLANYEFLLPPKRQQAQLAELLWAMDEVVNNGTKSINNCRSLYKSKREHSNFTIDKNADLIYNNRLKSQVSKTIQYRRLEDVLLNIKYGTSKKGNSEGRGYKVIGIPNVINEKLTIDKCAHVELNDKEYEACKLHFGDIVIVRTNGNPKYTGRSALYDVDGEHAFASYLIKVTVDKKIYNPEYLVRYLQTNMIRRYFRRNATSTAGNYNINTEIIKNVPVPILPLSKQNEVLLKLREIEERYTRLLEYLKNSKTLQKSLINQVF